MAARRHTLWILAALACIGASAPPDSVQHSAPMPTFEQHHVPVERIARPVSAQMDAATRHIADQVRKAMRGAPDFAGHYSLVFDGCGASCVAAGALDLRTGRTIWLPFTVCCFAVTVTEPIEYRADSTLVIIHGSRNEIGSGTYYYNFDGRRFRLLREQKQDAPA